MNAPEKFKTQTSLLINQTGFRYGNVDRSFLESRLDWVYGSATKLARMARQLCFVVANSVAGERRRLKENNVFPKNMPKPPETYISLNQVAPNKRSIIELYGYPLDKEFSSPLSIEVSYCLKCDVEETNRIMAGEVNTISPGDFAVYLKEQARQYANSELVYKIPALDFIETLASLVNEYGNHIIPLHMHWRSIEEKTSVSIVFTPKTVDPEYSLTIKFEIN